MDRTGARIARALLAVGVLLCCPLGPARAHSTTYAVYSKFEATARGPDLALVFALDRDAVLGWAKRETGNESLTPEALGSLRGPFSRYLFERFFVANEGVSCSHPPELTQFGWDGATKRVLAVTAFHCARRLSKLQLHSLVTHDLPIAHELVGDTAHDGGLERSFFYDDNNVVELDLGAPKRADARPAGRRRGRFAHVALPDKKRRYVALAERELDRLAPQPLASFVHALGQGARHVPEGPEHLLFLAALWLGAATLGRASVLIVLFTASHALALALESAGLMSVAPRVTEPLTALLLLAAAVQTMRRLDQSGLPSIALAFGFVHGFGALALAAGTARVPAMLGFDLGLLLAQLTLVFAAHPLVRWLRHRPGRDDRRAREALGLIVLVLCALLVVWRVGHATVVS